MRAPKANVRSPLSLDCERAKAIAALAQSTHQNPAGSVQGDSLANRDPQALARFRLAITGLDEASACELVALIWVGRGDFARADWDKALVAARDISKDDLVAYIEGIPLVADYLLQGLNEVAATREV